MKSKKGESPRWFIWTLVILAVAGVALVTYIMTSGEQYIDGSTVIHRDRASIKR